MWEHDGIICTGETYKDKVKLTFAFGARIDDPNGLFNSSLDGNTRRAIDFSEGDTIDEAGFKSTCSRSGGIQRREATALGGEPLLDQPDRLGDRRVDVELARVEHDRIAAPA